MLLYLNRCVFYAFLENQCRIGKFMASTVSCSFTNVCDSSGRCDLPAMYIRCHRTINPRRRVIGATLLTFFVPLNFHEIPLYSITLRPATTSHHIALILTPNLPHSIPSDPQPPRPSPPNPSSTSLQHVSSSIFLINKIPKSTVSPQHQTLSNVGKTPSCLSNVPSVKF